MPRILAISSQVVCGAVGLSVMTPALQRLGHEVLALPTVLLSSHPGFAQVAGLTVPPERLAAMLDAMAANGWLNDLSAVLTGYLPTAAHVTVAAEAIAAARRASPDLLVVCDPVVGDDPKGLYIDAPAAAAIRDEVLPIADLATPNRFELAWLTGREVHTIDDAARALACLGSGGGVATSIPGQNPQDLANVANAGPSLCLTRTHRHDAVPHGTGDLFAALLVSALTKGANLPTALADATARCDHVITASLRRSALDVAALPLTPAPRAWPTTSWTR